MFFAYNNGITATAEEVDISKDGGRLLVYRLRNFQIVNGGQTTASIHVAKLRKIDLSRTFVQMKLSVVNAERAAKLVPQISKYANSQNRISAADFFSNHPFHIRIEEFPAVFMRRRLTAPFVRASGSMNGREDSTQMPGLDSLLRSAKSSIWCIRDASYSRRPTLQSSSTSGNDDHTRLAWAHKKLRSLCRPYRSSMAKGT